MTNIQQVTLVPELNSSAWAPGRTPIQAPELAQEAYCHAPQTLLAPSFPGCLLLSPAASVRKNSGRWRPHTNHASHL
jgi:hypothetical protein